MSQSVSVYCYIKNIVTVSIVCVYIYIHVVVMGRNVHYSVYFNADK